MRFQQERARVALAGALETMEPGRYGQRRPDAPWRSPREETPAFLGWQLGDTFQVHVEMQVSSDATTARRDSPSTAMSRSVQMACHRWPRL